MTQTIEISGLIEGKKLLEELAHVLHNLRFFTKFWNEHGGFEARRNMNRWQERADKLLDSIGLTMHNYTDAVKVIREQ